MDDGMDVFDEHGVRVCGIADALALVGERWSLLVIRELSLGVHRFEDIREHLGAPRDTVAARLKSLERAGVIERRQYTDRPPRFEYWLTPSGHDLAPVLGALRVWGRSHAPAMTVPVAPDA